MLTMICLRSTSSLMKASSSGCKHHTQLLWTLIKYAAVQKVDIFVYKVIDDNELSPEYILTGCVIIQIMNGYECNGTDILEHLNNINIL